MHRHLPLLLAVLVASPAAATGPSSADVILLPLAARNGHVLFATRWTSNPEGAHRSMRVDYGWLVASARGTWEEAPHRSVVPAETWSQAASDAEAAQERALDDALWAPLDWARPPESLVPLLRKYGFGEKDAIARDTGEGTLVWLPTRLCDAKRCAPSCKQRSLRGLRGDTGWGWPVAAAFVHSGLALFHNASTDQAEPRGLGSSVEERGTGFMPERPLAEWHPSGMDTESVSGLCVVPAALRAPGRKR